jgi:hypothetical protein
MGLVTKWGPLSIVLYGRDCCDRLLDQPERRSLRSATFAVTRYLKKSFHRGVLDCCGRLLEQPENLRSATFAMTRHNPNNSCDRRVNSQHFTLLVAKPKTRVGSFFYKVADISDLIHFFLSHHYFSDRFPYTLSFIVTMSKWFIFRIARIIRKN